MKGATWRSMSAVTAFWIATVPYQVRSHCRLRSRALSNSRLAEGGEGGPDAAGRRDLEPIERRPRHHREPRRRVELPRRIEKAAQLLRLVVRHGPGRRRILHPAVAPQEGAGGEQVPAADHAGIARMRLDRAEAAAVEPDRAARIERAGARLQADHGVGAEAELRRQRPRQHRHAPQRARIEDLPEALQAFRQLHAVDAVLQVPVLAADMDVAEAVLHHARRLQQHLVERLVGAARQRLDRAAIDLVLARPEPGEDALPRRFRPPRLHHQLGQRRLGQIGGERRRSCRARPASAHQRTRRRAAPAPRRWRERRKRDGRAACVDVIT